MHTKQTNLSTQFLSLYKKVIIIRIIYMIDNSKSLVTCLLAHDHQSSTIQRQEMQNNKFKKQ